MMTIKLHIIEMICLRRAFLGIFFTSFSLNIFAQWTPSKSSVAKADKEIIKYFGFELEKTVISSGTNHYMLSINDSVFGYLCFEQAPSKHDYFDYIAIYSKNMDLIKLRVLVYRENYGGEIVNKKWLSQFISRPSKKVQAISGATISVESMKFAVDQLNAKMQLWKLSN